MICGRLTGIEIPQSPRYTPGDCGAADGNCGIKSFSSYDFVNWTLLDFYQPPSSVANITKPVVRYSNATAQYVMVMGGNVIEGNFFYTASRSPSGPWGMSPKTMHGEDISHDFDIAVGPDGTHYMVTDVWTHKFTSDAVPMWDLWVHQLAPNLTSTMDNASSVLFRRGEDLWKGQGLTLEAVGFFLPRRLLVHHLGRDCSKRRRLPGYVYYHYAQNPLGPWKDGGIVSMDGCGAQIKGINVLPSDQGPVILAGMLGYRTGPSNYITQGNIHNFGAHVWHADNQQAAASSYLFPIEFNVDHTNKNWTCPTSVKIPLANSVNNQPEEPTAYQLDCRVRIWQDVIATFDPPIKSTRLQFPVWQRTDNLAPTINAGPTWAKQEFSYPASNISWTPTMITMDLAGATIASIKLSTNATNGCYGMMAEPKVNNGRSYGTIKGIQGYKTDNAEAQLYIHQLSMTYPTSRVTMGTPPLPRRRWP